MSQSPNQRAPAPRRHAALLGAEQQRGRAIQASPSWSAAVVHLSFTSVKTIGVAALLVMLTACASRLTDRENSWTASNAVFQRQRREADARAREAGDNRPHPEGWVGLPRNRDPKVVESIRVGQTMSEVANIMGTEGWSRTSTRLEFVASLHRTYGQYATLKKLPEDLRGIVERLPMQGRSVQWQYQGFRSTADWIVVFFASPENAPESEPGVVSRGVFRLGCL